MLPENAKMSSMAAQAMPWPIAAARPGDRRSPQRPPSCEPTIMPDPASTSSAGSAAAAQPPKFSSQGDT